MASAAPAGWPLQSRWGICIPWCIPDFWMWYLILKINDLHDF
jgi:hypothetical protein